MSFRACEVLPGVWHIADPMGVCCTLLAGRDRALLVDTGYGFEDLAAFVRTLTDRPLSVLLTHGHHDHALGAIHFERALAFPEEAGVLALYTGEAQPLVTAGEGWLFSMDGEAFTADIPTAVDAGDYTVYFKAAEDAEAQALTVTVAKADVTLIPPEAMTGEE